MMMILSSVMVMSFFMVFFSWYLLEFFLYFISFVTLWWFVSFSVVGYSMENMFMFTDWLSIMLMILSILITSLMLTGSYTSVSMVKKNLYSFSVLSLMMLMFLLLTFMSSKVIFFYIFFEASLIPIFLLIMGWGYQPERLQAGLYMLFYTIFASLPLLVVILMENDSFSLLSYQDLFMKTESLFSNMICVLFIFAFLVKLPMFMVHLWLPKAHVEAPVAGSMILAGVLLKLGSYGIWRISAYLIGVITNFKDIFMVMGLIGGVITSFICMVQVDMKSLIAYSSVVHMGILLSGMATFSSYGFEGALCMMLGHGLVSSGLFYLVGVYYDRVGSRSLFISKGMMVIFPALTVSWFMLSVYNISAPPSVSLLGEIFLTSSILAWSSMTFIWLIMMNFMAMSYTFYLYAQSQQGKVMSGLYSMSLIFIREYMVSLLHYMLVTLLVLMFWIL